MAKLMRMSGESKIVFAVEDQVDGKPLSAAMIPLNLLREFAADVETFVRGTGGEGALRPRDVIVAVQDGCFALEANFASLTPIPGILGSLSISDDLANLDNQRASILEAWQRRSHRSLNRSYYIKDVDSGTTVRINKDSNFSNKQLDRWVSVQRKVVGEIVDAGGASKANIHVNTAFGQLTIASDRETIANEEFNPVYHKRLLKISAKENVRTGELRDARLISFEDYNPTRSDAARARMHERGREAWADVSDSVVWVRSERGD